MVLLAVLRPILQCRAKVLQCGRIFGIKASGLQIPGDRRFVIFIATIYASFVLIQRREQAQLARFAVRKRRVRRTGLFALILREKSVITVGDRVNVPVRWLDIEIERLARTRGQTS